MPCEKTMWLSSPPLNKLNSADVINFDLLDLHK